MVAEIEILDAPIALRMACRSVTTKDFSPVVPICAGELTRSEAINELRKYPQREMPVTSRFEPGVYLREIFMPADTWVVGHVHKTRHFNIVLSGRARVSMNGGEAKVVQAGDVFASDAGVQKWLYIEEDCRWITVHANPDGIRDVVAMEEILVKLEPDFLNAKGGMTLDEFRLSVNQTLTD